MMSTTLRVAVAPLRLSPDAPIDQSVGRWLQQRVAVCDALGVLAVAHGRFVDLYQADKPLASEVFDEDADLRLHLPFLAQIALDEYASFVPASCGSLTGLGRDWGEEATMTATCVCFPTDSVLVVGATTEASGSFLLGFRLYPSAVTQLLPTSSDDRSKRHPSPLLVHFNYLEPVLTAAPPVAMIPCPHLSTPHSGAMVLLLANSSEFAVFSWRERFSSRQICAASVTGNPEPLTAIAVTDDGRFLVTANAAGYIYMLDFARFAWDARAEDGGATATSDVAGKRIKLGVCSRSGLLVEDNPLDAVRILGSTRDTQEGEHVTCLQWWNWRCGNQRKDHILAGKQNGALNVFRLAKLSAGLDPCFHLKLIESYPGPLSCKMNAVMAVTPPLCLRQAGSNRADVFAFHTISRTKWRNWEVSVDNPREKDGKTTSRVTWPSLKTSLELATYSLPSEVDSGVVLLSSLSVTSISHAISGIVMENYRHDTRYCSVAIVPHKHCLQFVVHMIEDREITSDNLDNSSGSTGDTGASANELRDAASTQSEAFNMSEPPHIPEPSSTPEPGRTQDPQSVPEVRSILDPPSTPRSFIQSPSMPAPTIQEKYKLPAMDLGPKSAQPTAEGQVQRGNTNQDLSNKVSKVEYDERVSVLGQRVSEISSTLKMMRNSFSLFTADAFQHMNALSHAIEDALGDPELSSTRGDHGECSFEEQEMEKGYLQAQAELARFDGDRRSSQTPPSRDGIAASGGAGAEFVPHLTDKYDPEHPDADWGGYVQRSYKKRFYCDPSGARNNLAYDEQGGIMPNDSQVAPNNLSGKKFFDSNQLPGNDEAVPGIPFQSAVYQVGPGCDSSSRDWKSSYAAQTAMESTPKDVYVLGTRQNSQHRRHVTPMYEQPTRRASGGTPSSWDGTARGSSPSAPPTASSGSLSSRRVDTRRSLLAGIGKLVAADELSENLTRPDRHLSESYANPASKVLLAENHHSATVGYTGRRNL